MTHISTIAEIKKNSAVYLFRVFDITDVHIETSFSFATNAIYFLHVYLLGVIPIFIIGTRLKLSITDSLSTRNCIFDFFHSNC